MKNAKDAIHKKGTAGLTLIELTVVLAIIAIIAAILIPVFMFTTDRARLRADIQSAQVLQNAVELHRLERGYDVNGVATNIVADVIAGLVAAGYINPRRVPDRPQTEGAVWYRDATTGIIMVDIIGSPDSIRDDAYNSLRPSERVYVRR